VKWRSASAGSLAGRAADSLPLTDAAADAASSGPANFGPASSGLASAAQAGGAAAGPAEAARKRRHGDPLRAALFAVLVLAVLAGVGWALLGSSLLVVRHVEVTGNRLVTAAQVRSAARIPAGQPLARVNTAAAAARVERIPAVLSAKVTRAWPQTIVIAVRERTPGVAVAVGAGFDLVDEYGVTVQWAAHKPAGLPLLAAPPAALRGSPDVRSAVLVLRALPRGLRRKVVSVLAASPTSVTLYLSDGATVLWGGTGHAAQKSAELAMLLRTHARYYDVSDPSTAVSQG
jgi:cell division protein FtsQ